MSGVCNIQWRPKSPQDGTWYFPADVLNLRSPEHARRPHGPVLTLKVRTETLLVACKDIVEGEKGSREAVRRRNLSPARLSILSVSGVCQKSRFRPQVFQVGLTFDRVPIGDCSRVAIPWQTFRFQVVVQSI